MVYQLLRLLLLNFKLRKCSHMLAHPGVAYDRRGKCIGVWVFHVFYCVFIAFNLCFLVSLSTFKQLVPLVCIFLRGHFTGIYFRFESGLGCQTLIDLFLFFEALLGFTQFDFFTLQHEVIAKFGRVSRHVRSRLVHRSCRSKCWLAGDCFFQQTASLVVFRLRSANEVFSVLTQVEEIVAYLFLRFLVDWPGSVFLEWLRSLSLLLVILLLFARLH